MGLPFASSATWPSTRTNRFGDVDCAATRKLVTLTLHPEVLSGHLYPSTIEHFALLPDGKAPLRHCLLRGTDCVPAAPAGVANDTICGTTSTVITANNATKPAPVFVTTKCVRRRAMV